MFKIATWNVNSLRVRLPHVLQWLEEHKPDVLALQETKLIDKDFPLTEITAAGYNVIYQGQPGFNGVALLSRSSIQNISRETDYGLDPLCRLIAATVEGIRILNVYVPNGGNLDSDKYPFKLKWMSQLATILKKELHQHPKLIVLGDFNVAPEDRDVHDPVAWEGQVLVSGPERQALKEIMDLGLVDTFRLFEQPEKIYSWWDYRAAAFRRNMGLRIDLILASQALEKNCQHCQIDKTPRKWERPSDHAPVIASFA